MVVEAQQIRPEIAHLAVPLAQLQPYARNPRQGDVGAISESLRLHGQFRPIVVNKRTSVVLAGNHTLAAARALGWREIAVTYVDVDEHKAAQIVLADNRANDLASNDAARLADLLQSLPTLEGTLYDGDALDALLDDLSAPLAAPGREGDSDGDGTSPEGDLDAVPEPPAVPRTQPHDLLELGPHRLLCGDCRDRAATARLLEGSPVNLVVTSPPYAAQRAYDQSSGFAPIATEGYVAWYHAVAALLAEHLAPDGSYLLNIKEHTMDGQRALYVKELVLAHAREWGWLFVDEFCWLKTAMPGEYSGRFKNGWEPVFHFTRAPRHKWDPDAMLTPSAEVPIFAPETNFKMGPGGLQEGEPPAKAPGLARPSNVLNLRGVGADRTEGPHPAAFPVALPAWFIRAFSATGDLVYDPFCGSGSTLVAAERAGRRFVGMEISPAYCDVVAQRYAALTGQQARWHPAAAAPAHGHVRP